MMNERLTVDDLLLAHAAGRLPEPVGLVVATHLALAPEQCRIFQEYEALGGAMLEDLPPAELGAGALERLMARLDDSVEHTQPPPGGELPAPLCAYVQGSLADLPWRHFGGISEARLPLDDETYRTRLIRLRAGRSVPRHTHDGRELTVVLEGAFHDGLESYAVGDIAIADPDVEHQPRAMGDEDCLCLTVTDAPLRMTGRFSRFLNPFLRF